MVLCIRCEKNVVPMKRYEKDGNTGKGWFISYCPNERCKFNFDLEPYVAPKSPKTPGIKRCFLWPGMP